MTTFLTSFKADKSSEKALENVNVKKYFLLFYKQENCFFLLLAFFPPKV